ncbi:MAG: hypothetical protein ACO1ON_03630 [Nocardioides sp.]|uniref:hypothetical protein n=1 Tax=Nocardioides sp. TaxID=35761 RepID=UPI00261E09E2|nr:hypothetical protein [Nocardioides sp.]
MSAETSLLVLLAATWAHLGFQVTVSSLVYPVLAAAATSPEGWRRAHERHSRVITPTVGAVYAALLLGTAASLSTAAGPAVVAAAAGVALSLGTTALVAAPLHGRLATAGPTPERLRRLLVADRVRTAGAAVAAVAASLAVV